MTESPYRIYFGDLHNHNACGLGTGSMERTVEIARSHLDFFAFTGHASWHDIPSMEDGDGKDRIRGFERLKSDWPWVQCLIADYHREGAFVPFLGFEWQSRRFGDHCVIFPEDYQALIYPESIDILRTYCQQRGALLIPHHLDRSREDRGINWAAFNTACSPVVEILSGPWREGNDPLSRDQLIDDSIQAALNKGHRFGFVASSDSHTGFPGAHGEGLTAILATDLSRRALFDALRARRTYALTGDRMEVGLSVDGALMGAEISAESNMEVFFDVGGRDALEAVELVLDGRVIHRALPNKGNAASDQEACTDQIRLAWGPDMIPVSSSEPVIDWRFDIRISNARLKRFFPEIGSFPFDEERRHRIERSGENTIRVQSFSAARPDPSNSRHALVLEVEGGADARLEITTAAPVVRQDTVFLRALRHDDGRSDESVWLHPRLVDSESRRISETIDIDAPQGPGVLYLRAKQRNGHRAWTSPVFINRA